MNQLDSSLVILPWNKNSSSPSLHSNSTIPDTVMILHKYLHKLFLPKKEIETTIYPQLHLGHDVDFDTLRENIYPWVQNTFPESRPSELSKIKRKTQYKIVQELYVNTSAKETKLLETLRAQQTISATATGIAVDRINRSNPQAKYS